MASTSSKPTSSSGLASLVPHGRFKGKPAMPLNRPVTVIGGRTRSHLHLVSSSVSKSHAMVVNSGAGFYIRDLASRTHVFVNGRQVNEADLRDGDIVAVGPFTFRFTDTTRAGVTSSSAGVPDGVLRMSNRPLPVPLDGRRVTVIGRRPTCDVTVDEMEVSTTHAVVFEMNGKRYIRDLGSRTGTFINGTAIHQEPLKFGDTIKIGSAVIMYAEAGAAEVGVEAPDDTEDLAGTAQLPAEPPLDLVYDEAPPAKPVEARKDRARAPIPAAGDNGQAAEAELPAPPELDLAMEAPIGVEHLDDLSSLTPPDETPVEAPAAPPAAAEAALPEVQPAPAAPPVLDLGVAPLEPTPAPVEASVVEESLAPPAPGLPPMVAEPGVESALGIELLPHEEPVADAPAEPAVAEPSSEAPPLPSDLPNEPAARAVESDFGLAFREPAEAPSDLAEDTPKKGPMWRRLFGRKKDEADIAMPAAEAAPPAPATELEPVELEPELDLAASGVDLPTLPDEERLAAETPESELIDPLPEPIDLTPADVEDLLALEPLPAAEVVEKTEPTPESALDLDNVLPLPPAPAAEPAPRPETMTDSVFGREVAAFEGPGLGPIVERPSGGGGGPGIDLDKELDLTLAADSGATEPSAAPDADVDALIYDDLPAAAAPSAPPAETPAATPEATEAPVAEVPVSEDAAAAVPAEEAAPKRRGGRRPAAAKPGRKPATPKRKAPISAEVATDVVPESLAEAPAELPAEAAAMAPLVEPVGAPTPSAEAAPVEEIPSFGEPAAEPTSDLPAIPDEIPAQPAAADVGEALVFDEGAAPAAADPLVFEEPVATTSAEAPVAEPEAEPELALEPAPPAEQPTAEQPEVEPPPAPRKPVDLFFGLERDTASFLGGMPLNLPPLQSPFAQQRVDFTRPPTPVAPSPAAEEIVDDEALADELPAPEPDEPELLPELTPAAEEPLPPEEPPAAAIPPAKPARPAPPPPARSAGRARGQQAPAAAASASPFGTDLGPGFEIPAFAGPGPATRGQVTTAFDGLAMPPVRETDVFSQGPLGEATIPPFAGPMPEKSSAADDELDLEDEEPLDLSQSEDELSGAAPAPTADESDAAMADAGAGVVADERKPRPAPVPPRRPPSYPAEPVGGRPAQPAPKKKRWRIGRWGLLGIMLLCMAGAAAGIAFLGPKPAAQVSATLRFQKLETLTEAQRQQVLAEQRQKLERPEVRASAREILLKNHEGVSSGFLLETGDPGDVTATARTYLDFTGSLRLTEKKPMIVGRLKALGGDADRARVASLLAALYAENKPLVDAEAELSRAFNEKSDLLRLAHERLKSDVKPQVDAARQELGGGPEALAEKQRLVEALGRKERELSTTWMETTARVQELTADVRAAESAVPFDPAADPDGKLASADDDPQVAELSLRAKQLSENLAAKKQEQTARADDARKTLATALKQFEDDIAKARGTMKADSELGRYLDSAARIQSQLKVLSGELAQQQRSDMQRLTMLKQKLAEKNEARIREAFASDPDLQAIQENLALKERQHSTAVGSGLKDDASALDKEIAGLKQQIESRQDLLTTADGIAPGAKELEEFVTDTLKRMESDRLRNDRRMADMLKELAGQAPAAGSLTAEQKAFAEQLEKRQAELNKAREGYAAAVDAAAAEADEQLKALETELAAAQAKIDERKKQVAEAARKSLSEEQQKERQATTASRQRTLERAQRADQTAADAYASNRRALVEATDELERLKKRAESFDRENSKAMQLQASIQSLSEDVDRLRQRRDAAIIPMAPEDEDVTLARAGDDRRGIYIVASIAVLLVVFGALFLILPGETHQEAGADDYYDDEFPLAVTARYPDESAQAAATAVEDATAAAERDRRQPRKKESPVTV